MLDPRDGWTPIDSLVAARTIARGLLESVVADLAPEQFQPLLLARLERMETSTASALDMALVDLHADIIAGIAALRGQLKRALDRLPPGPAERGEIALYLAALIDWLDRDPWPRGRRFHGPLLTPTSIERKLRVNAASLSDEQSCDADELALQCHRLVLLGAPGSGKTWLAKRTARRCAERALDALAAGANLDETELPLYTTCSRLVSADGDIRHAAVSSALNQLGDLGGSRVNVALLKFFVERNSPTALVIDSLDEAHGGYERLRQADTLPWRIVLTTRESSWNHQLVIDPKNESHCLGELQPLRYPDDVELVIHSWFSSQPERGADLAAQIARRPGLQQIVTVPLILAFYCIVSGDGPLPEFRRDLYARVINRMLTGGWHGSNDSQPDTAACLHTLRGLAWSGAAAHPVSGIGVWPDDIETGPAKLCEAEKIALDHIAAPLGPRDVDTGTTVRRFIHRSVREHLVAEYVAGFSAAEAAEILLPHLWHDPDWEYAAPAAIAQHPQHDQLLRDLTCRAAKSDQIPPSLCVIDAGWEWRRLLARVAAESCETDWSPEIAQMIGQARVDLARSDHPGELSGSGTWETSNGRARQVLFERLEGGIDPRTATVAGALVQLSTTAEHKRQVREEYCKLLTGEAFSRAVRDLSDAVIRLAVTAEDKRQTRSALLNLVRVAPEWAITDLASVVAHLDPTPEDRRQVCEVLLEMLAAETHCETASFLIDAVVALIATPEDWQHAQEDLLGLLIGDADYWVTAGLADAVIELAKTSDDICRTRDVMLGLLARETDSGLAVILARGVAHLCPSIDHQRQVRDALLCLIADETDYETAEALIGEIIKLISTEEDTREVRDALLRLFVDSDSDVVVVGMASEMSRLAITTEEKDQALAVMLVSLIDSLPGGWIAEELTDGAVQLATTAEGRQLARMIFLRLLAGPVDDRMARALVRGAVKLAMTDKTNGKSASRF